MIALPVFFISILGLLIATYTDLKNRIIPNTLTYGLIVLGLLFHAYSSYTTQSLDPLLFSATATVAAFLFAYVLWKLGVWAGGDVKMFTALAALNPINYFVIGSFLSLTDPLFTPTLIPLFFLSLFFASLFAMLPYALLISITGLFSQPKLLATFTTELKQTLTFTLIKAIQLAAFVYGFQFLLAFLSQHFAFILPGALSWILSLLFLIGVSTFKTKLRWGIALLFGVFAIIGSLENLFLLANNIFTLFFILLAIAVLFKLFAFNKQVLRTTVPVKSLEEGMIPFQTLVQKGSTIHVLPGLSFGLLLSTLKSLASGKNQNHLKEFMNVINPKGKLLADSRSAAGLTQAQVNVLQTLAKEKKIARNFIIKISAPFAPALLIAFLALQLVGDLLWNLIL